MCPYPEVHEDLPQGVMDDELYHKIIDECSEHTELKLIQLFLMNEPLMDRKIVERINYAKEKNPHAVVSITSNGALLTENMADRLAQSKLYSLFISINGSSPETYRRIMGLDYEKVLRNVNYLIDIQPRRLKVFIYVVDMRGMEPEIEEAIAYWQKRGVKVHVMPVVNRGGNVLNFAKLKLRQVVEPQGPCPLLFGACILYNGDVILCCADWRRDVIMGNVRNRSLHDVWRCEKYNHYRGMHLLKRTSELRLCQSCSTIRIGAKTT